jgi:hypothetical protein
MKIDMKQANPTIDAVDLGNLLSIAPAEVVALMRAGEITSRFETGADEHAGTHRLTFWYRNTRVRITCDDDGNVTKTTRTNSPRPE